MYIYNMSNYKIKVTQTKDLINAKMVTMQINRKDKDMIKISEIKKLTKKLIEENDGSKIRIRGLGISHMATVGEAVFSTLKGLDDDLNVKDIEEYFAGRVADTNKFLNFSMLQITIVSPTD